MRHFEASFSEQEQLNKRIFAPMEFCLLYDQTFFIQNWPLTSLARARVVKRDGAKTTFGLFFF